MALAPENIARTVFLALVNKMPGFGYMRIDPLVILAQADFETGGFTSDLVVWHNNAFGMRAPNTRNLYTGQTASGFATYAGANGLDVSVHDYLQRQEQFHIPDTSNATAYMNATAGPRTPGSLGYVPLSDREQYVTRWHARYAAMPTRAWFTSAGFQMWAHNLPEGYEFREENGELVTYIGGLRWNDYNALRYGIDPNNEPPPVAVGPTRGGPVGHGDGSGTGDVDGSGTGDDTAGGAGEGGKGTGGTGMMVLIALGAAIAMSK